MVDRLDRLCIQIPFLRDFVASVVAACVTITNGFEIVREFKLV